MLDLGEAKPVYSNHEMLARCGEDVFFGPQCYIKRLELGHIGSHCAIDGFFWCTTGLELGDYVHIGPHVSIIGGADGRVKMGNFSSLAAGCRVIAGTDNYNGDGFQVPMVPKQYRDSTTIKPITIGNYVGVATGVTILPGVTLAEGSVIAAGGLVRQDTEPWKIYVVEPSTGRLMAVKRRPSENILKYAKEMGYE